MSGPDPPGYAAHVQGIELIPEGELEGMPAVRVLLPSAPTTSEYLVKEFTSHWRSGVKVLWLESGAWGTSGLEACIGYFQSDARTHAMAIWCPRIIHEKEWSPTPLWNVVDCTSLMSAPVTSSSMVEQILGLPYIPRPTEIVINDPAEACLLPGLLDEITTHLNPERAAWIHLTDPNPRVLERASVAISSASHGWGIRVRRQK